MPLYQCHKKVSALKIVEVIPSKEIPEGYSATILMFEQPFEPIKLDIDYVKKHNPQVGGYYVVYEDGYTSYSPAVPFESGYTRI